MRIPTTKIAWNKSLHRGAEVLLKGLKARWEVRRVGESQLGLWRVNLGRGSESQKKNPRRLVVVPGFGDSSLSWIPVLVPALPWISKNHDELILVDFPGFFGFLRQESCFPSMDLILQVTSDLFDELQPTTLLGHSLGGWISAHYAAAKGEKSSRKDRLENLVLLSPSGLFEDPKEREEWRARFEYALEDGTGWFQKHLFHRPPKWFKAMLWEFSDFFSRPDSVQFLKSVEARHELNGRLHQIRARTWVIWGEHDSLSPSKWAADWAERIGTRAQAIVVKESEHGFQLERPVVLGALLAKVFAQGRNEGRIRSNRFWENRTRHVSEAPLSEKEEADTSFSHA